jgi:hypothetical protein
VSMKGMIVAVEFARRGGDPGIGADEGQPR